VSFYASSIVTELEETNGMSADERDRYLEDKGGKHGYVWFIGEDGEMHFGIEKEPLLKRH
jgi:hypothetical protein